MKQGALAERMGVSQAYLSLVESGKKEPSLAFVRNAADVLQTPLPFILLVALDEEDFPARQKDLLEGITAALIDAFLMTLKAREALEEGEKANDAKPEPPRMDAGHP